jgi:hypothetical protein
LPKLSARGRKNRRVRLYGVGVLTNLRLYTLADDVYVGVSADKIFATSVARLLTLMNIVGVRTICPTRMRRRRRRMPGMQRKRVAKVVNGLSIRRLLMPMDA